MQHQKRVVQCGAWPLYRYDPRREQQGQNPFQLDSKEPKVPFREHAEAETRFRTLLQSQPARAETLIAQAQAEINARYKRYARLAEPWGEQVEA